MTEISQDFQLVFSLSHLLRRFQDPPQNDALVAFDFKACMMYIIFLHSLIAKAKKKVSVDVMIFKTIFW